MTRAEMRLGALSLLTALTIGCGGATPMGTSCTDIGVFGIVIKTFDAITNEPVTVNGTAVAVDGSYREETPGYAYQGGGVAYSMAAERAGRYKLTVTVSGFQVWSQDDVNVRQGICHVETVTVDARLVH